MDCPVDRHALRHTQLEDGLQAFECPECTGRWLRFGEYLTWRERNPEDTPEVPPELVPDLGAAPESGFSGVRRCPDCDYLLTRFRVGHGVPFMLDRCGHCNGIWMDHAEWETLRARGLHDNLHEMFDPLWQRAARNEAQRDATEAQFARRLGADTMWRTREFGAWLSKHPKRSEILAYLQWHVR